MSSKHTVEALLEPVGIVVNGNHPWDPQIHDERVFNDVVRFGTLGAGEAYVDGRWDCAAIDVLVAKLGGSATDLKGMGKLEIARAVALNAIGNAQTMARAGRNASHHYNIGNDLYQAMLGPTMAYSCAYWDGGATNLDEAQTAKFSLICRKLGLEKGMRLLDVGCGWGGLAFFAAKQYGVEVVGITPAAEQAKFVEKKAEETQTNVTALQQDYRDPIDGTFDRVVSVGMFEHVGPKNYREYFERMLELTDDDGLFLLHTIGAGNRTRRINDPWIEKYIFPGGRLPSMEQIAKAANGLWLFEDVHNFGSNYDNTLMEWHKNFIKAWPELASKYGERFKRMWEYYLLSCAGSFRSRSNSLWQIVLSKSGVAGGYKSVR